MYAISLDFCKSFYDNGSSSDQGYKNRPIFSKIVEKWQNGIGSNLKTIENTVHCFKILEKDKISKIYVKKLNRILRLLVKNFL
jgi:hypothetical protein